MTAGLREREEGNEVVGRYVKIRVISFKLSHNLSLDKVIKETRDVI